MTGISGASPSRPSSPTHAIEASNTDKEERAPSGLAGSVRSVSQSSDDPLGFTVIRSWTLDRIDKELAKINFSMALTRTIPEGKEQAPDIEEDSSEPIDIKADILINGNSALGLGTFIDRDITFTTEILSNHPPDNPSDEGMAQQEQVLTLFKEGLKFSSIGTSWGSYGTITSLCLKSKPLDENALENDDARTHLVFNDGIYLPLEKSAQDRYSFILEDCIDARTAQDSKGISAALTGLARLYNEGQLKPKAVDQENLLGQWKLEMINTDELEDSAIFEWAQTENGTYTVTRSYKGANAEQLTCQSSSSVDVAAVKTQTASSKPPSDKTICNFLFWDAPDSNSALSPKEQENQFYASPPIVISSSEEHILFISQDGQNTFLLKSYDPDTESDTYLRNSDSSDDEASDTEATSELTN